MSPATIGFVGLGNMGAPMAANIAAGGFPLTCFDAAGTRERMPRGAAGAHSVADLARAADTVLLSLPDGAVTRAVSAALATAPGRRVTTVIDLSTIGPQPAREIAADLAPLGVAYVDGPVSGGVAGAREATIALMFAGPAAVLEAHRDLLAAFTGRVFHVGLAPGQGQAMKVLNNFLSAVALAATSEALSLGRAHGLDMATMIEVLNASTGRNSATADKFPRRILTGSFDAGFHTALMAKDMRLYADTAAAVGSPAAVGRVVAEVWQACEEALPGSDFTRIWSFVSGDPATP